MATDHTRHTARFGEFEVDRMSGQLRRHGVKIRLPEQSFRVLMTLIERAGELVTREDLRRELWAGDTFVDFEAGMNSAIKRLRDALGDSAISPQFVETLPRRGYRFIASVDRSAEAPFTSLAVLPLQNLIGDAAQDFFVDGMTDALISRLAQISALRVPSRTSVMRFKGSGKGLPEIARELNVDAVIEGSVTRSRDRVRITVQLVDGRSDVHLWAREYEREMTDILLLQAEVAQAVSDEIRVKVTPQERARLATARLVNPRAYEAYLRGRFHWDRRTEEAMRKGLAMFERALAEDPSFALSQTGIAECYNMLGYWGVAAPDEAASNARSAATKALEIDASLAEAHAALGWTHLAHDWNWTAAEQDFLRAIALQSTYATAHQWYSHLLVYQGRVAEALERVQRTLELEPLSLVMNANSAFVCLLARKNDEAIACAEKALELDPHFAPAYLWSGWALQQMGRTKEADAALRKALQMSGNGPRYLATLGHASAMAGNASEAADVINQMETIAAQRYVSAYDFATVYAGLGDDENVFLWLDRAYAERATWLVLLNVDSRFDVFHHDSRFHGLLGRLSLLR